MARSRVLTGMLGLLMVAGPAAVSASAVPAAGAARPARAELQLVRETPTGEFGINRPGALTWNDQLGSLLLTQGRRLVRVSTDGTPLSAARLPAPPRHGSLAVHPSSGATSYLAGAELHAMTRGAAAAARPAVRRAPQRFGAGVSGLAYDGAGRLVGMRDGALLRYAGARVVRMPIQGVAGHDLRGLARWPGSGLLLTFDQDTGRVLAVDAAGRVRRELDTSSMDLRNVTGLGVAPSADATDDPDVQHLYLADAGDASVLGRLVETSLAAAPSAAALAAPTATATLVATGDTSLWSPPSPDPSGVTYIPGTDRLMVSDGEVDEMPIYAGANFYNATRGGTLNGTGTTPPWSNEPTGVALNQTNGHLLVSDDDKKSIFEIASPGVDGRYGTADDGARTVFKTSTFGNTDPEDVGFDTLRGEMLLMDGVGRELFRLNPGPNGVFNGVAPGGDDIATQFDVEQFGALDPEGVAYDAVRDTVLVVDETSKSIYELDTNGSLITRIDISAAGSQKAAGITIAPASNGSGAPRYYVVDRGLDNNSHPGENDGKVYELSVSLPPITNRPPAANAGPDLLMDLPETANLNGSALDDGNPSGVLTYAWTETSGPGTVTFGDPAAATTTATFSATGTYLLRLTVSDGALDDTDDVVVNVFQPGAPRTVQLPIVSGADDAMEGGGTSGKFVDLASADVELGHSGPPSNTAMLDGLRFSGIPVPQNGEIVSAKIQFKVDETGSEAASYTISGEANDHAPTYVAAAGNISARPGTTATVPWSPPAWTLIGDAGPGQLTPDLKGIVQEIVNRPGWVQGNALAFMINGTGRRTAEAKDGLSPPVLVLTYRMFPPNGAPVVDAGADQTIQLPAQASLDGTVTDDGQPQATPTTTWSKVSGPGTVTFGSAGAVDTTAGFSLAGTYTLRLTANDGASITSDDVVVTVQPANAAPTVDAGPNRTVVMPAAASLDGTLVSAGFPGPVTTAWSVASGPGTATFGNAAAIDTTATFSAPGTYTLRLTATNLTGSSSDTMVVTVNKVPTVSAGPDLTITLPAQASLDGTLLDPGTPGTVKFAWSKVSGGSVSFSAAKSIDTLATFKKTGTYTLRLTATNGAGSSSDTVVVTVRN
jgi:PKD repeat protein